MWFSLEKTEKTMKFVINSSFWGEKGRDWLDNIVWWLKIPKKWKKFKKNNEKGLTMVQSGCIIYSSIKNYTR